MDYDKIVRIAAVFIVRGCLTYFGYAKMVLDAGCLVEFDSPKLLLKKEGGLFKALVDESDDSQNLKDMVIR